MSSEVVLHDDDVTPGLVRAELRAHSWTWKSTGACVGLLGGLITPLLGLALTALAWFVGDWHGYHLGRDSAAFFFLSIPLLIFGAHCLDMIDKENNATNNGN